MSEFIQANDLMYGFIPLNILHGQYLINVMGCRNEHHDRDEKGGG
ncbi:MAG: hypothetical protein ACXWFG_05495 [Methylobacter sp.]